MAISNSKLIVSQGVVKLPRDPINSFPFPLPSPLLQRRDGLVEHPADAEIVQRRNAHAWGDGALVIIQMEAS